MIYLDNSAGARPHPEVIKTITDVLTSHWGNASSDYSFGKDAMTIVDAVTQQVADDINCDTEEVIWTSGACEANSLAIIGTLNANPHMHFYTSRLEHTSINEIVKNHTGNFMQHVANDKRGLIMPEDLEDKLSMSHRVNASILVSISAANSEIGVIQDIKAISTIVHKYGGILHVDATQMFPWYKMDVQDLGIDLMSVSGQKMNCVKGIGFLYVRNGINIKPLIYGSQQHGLRGGTYPTHLIAAFGKALEITRNDCESKRYSVAALRNYFKRKLTAIDGANINGSWLYRLPNNISLTFDGVDASKLTTMCDLMGVVIAKGSACQSYEAKPSSTLLAIGLTSKQALSTIRISLDVFNTIEEIDYAANIITKLVERIRNEE